jgi:tetratricopeptide (TPR) repeat protein
MISEGNILLAMQRYEESIASFKRAMKISNRHHFAVNGLIWNYCLTGNVGKARSLMNELKERAEKEYIAKTFTALSAAYLGDMDEAFDYLEKAYNDRDPILLNLRYENWGPPRFRDCFFLPLF